MLHATGVCVNNMLCIQTFIYMYVEENIRLMTVEIYSNVSFSNKFLSQSDQCKCLPWINFNIDCIYVYIHLMSSFYLLLIDRHASYVGFEFCSIMSFHGLLKALINFSAYIYTSQTSASVCKNTFYQCL